VTPAAGGEKRLAASGTVPRKTVPRDWGFSAWADAPAALAGGFPQDRLRRANLTVLRLGGAISDVQGAALACRAEGLLHYAHTVQGWGAKRREPALTAC